MTRPLLDRASAIETLSSRRSQQGIGLMVFVMLIGVVLLTLFVGKLGAAGINLERAKLNAAVLARAKEALIAWSATHPSLPGRLPCPDSDNDGVANSPCGGAGESRLGRLPWKTLGLPDLRDADGECLWYAVSGRFKSSPSSTPINSDSNGQFIVVANDGVTPLAGATPDTQAIAVIFAPGGIVAGQDRSPAGATICGGNTIAANYLDTNGAINNSVVSAAAGATSTFIAGDRSAAFSDRLAFITPEQFFPVIETRVVREARVCLSEFSLQPGAHNRLPWAAPLTDVAGFADANGIRFGRIPSTLAATNVSLGAALNWPNPVQLTTPCFSGGSWWDSWREYLFYHVAPAYEPAIGPPSSCLPPGNCLTVNTTTSVLAVVSISGRAWRSNPDQSTRPLDKTIAANYLETDPLSTINNANGGATGTYAKDHSTSTAAANFNDKTECLQQIGALPCQ